MITKGNLTTTTISTVLQELSARSPSNLKSILEHITAGEIKYGPNFSPSLPWELVKRAAINLAASSQFECLYTDNGRCADGGQELTAILV
jgi:hypothetical protein